MFNIYVLLVLFYILQFVVSFILDPLGGFGIRCIAANSCFSPNQSVCYLRLGFRSHHPYFNQEHGELYHIFFLIFGFILKVLFS